MADLEHLINVVESCYAGNVGSWSPFRVSLYRSWPLQLGAFSSLP
jgi:hypothetical protein